MEYYSPNDNRMNRNCLLHINLGIHFPCRYHPSDVAQLHGGGTLVQSSSDRHSDPQHAAGKQLLCLVLELCWAPAVVAATPNYNPFFMNEQKYSCSSFTATSTAIFHANRIESICYAQAFTTTPVTSFIHAYTLVQYKSNYCYSILKPPFWTDCTKSFTNSSTNSKQSLWVSWFYLY